MGFHHSKVSCNRLIIQNGFHYHDLYLVPQKFIEELNKCFCLNWNIESWQVMILTVADTLNYAWLRLSIAQIWLQKRSPKSITIIFFCIFSLSFNVLNRQKNNLSLKITIKGIYFAGLFCPLSWSLVLAKYPLLQQGLKNGGWITIIPLSCFMHQKVTMC